MWDFLIELDKKLFLFLNSLNSPFMDVIMEGISDRFIWIPFYAILLFFLVRYYGKNSIYLILSVIVVITLCDQISVHLFKSLFQRLRPCHEQELQALVHLVNDHCGGQYGFVSSHAANSFGLAYLIGNLLGTKNSKWLFGLLTWAAVVSYSRIYLGVHYPMDVFVGAGLGIFIAVMVYSWLVNLDKNYNILQLK